MPQLVLVQRRLVGMMLAIRRQVAGGARGPLLRGRQQLLPRARWLRVFRLRGRFRCGRDCRDIVRHPWLCKQICNEQCVSERSQLLASRHSVVVRVTLRKAGFPSSEGNVRRAGFPGVPGTAATHSGTVSDIQRSDGVVCIYEGSLAAAVSRWLGWRLE
eukprot:1195472-Prorocentrum_minimum.AAC.1